MQQIQTIGIDLAKNVFQVHGIDENDEVVVAKQLRRNQVIPFFEKIESMPRRHGGMRDRSSLGARTDQTRS